MQNEFSLKKSSLSVLCGLGYNPHKLDRVWTELQAVQVHYISNRNS